MMLVLYPAFRSAIVFGEIEINGDIDWHRVEVEAGATYTIDLEVPKWPRHISRSSHIGNL